MRLGAYTASNNSLCGEALAVMLLKNVNTSLIFAPVYYTFQHICKHNVCIARADLYICINMFIREFFCVVAIAYIFTIILGGKHQLNNYNAI